MMRCVACNSIIESNRTNPITGKSEDLCHRCLSISKKTAQGVFIEENKDEILLDYVPKKEYD